MIEFLLSLKINRNDRVRDAARKKNLLRFELLESRYLLSGESLLNLDNNWQSAIFDNGINGTLPIQFERDTATVSPSGEALEVDQPRFGNERTLSEIDSWTAVLPITSNAEIYGSGWDHDGETPLSLLWDSTAHKMTFIRGENFNVVNTITLPGNLDLFRGQVSGYRYIPKAGVVYEGLVVVLLERGRREGTGWIVDGTSFAYTQDYGHTFQRIEQVGGGYDVPPIAGGASDGKNRGQSWSFTNAFPEKSTDDMLGAWFPWADYIYKTSYPQGGQVGVFRARRSSIGEPWVVEPNRLVYETWREDDSGGLHAHTAGMFVDGMVSFWGDVGYRNRMVRHVAADLENYTTTTWTHEEEFQGGWSPSDNPVYLLGNQALSAAPGPNFGEVLVVGDEQPELIMKVERPAHLGEKAIITSLSGSFPGANSGNSFTGRFAPFLQIVRGLGYIALEQSTNVPGANGVFYSSDGIHWAEVLQNPGYAYLYGNQIVTINAGTLYTIPIPTDVSVASPLLLNPGGQNLATLKPVLVGAPAAGNTARRVIYVNGLYKYQDTLVPLDVQPPGPPPVADGMPMWEFTSTGANRNMGGWELGNITSESNKLHWLSAWHYSLDGNGIAPAIRVGDTPNTERASEWVANNQWVPSLNYGVPNSSATGVDEQRFRMMNGLKGPAPRRWLTAIEGYVQGAAPTYPMAPGATGGNELASALLANTTSNWSTALTYGLSQVSAFSTYFDPAGLDTVHTLASIYESAADHIDVIFSRTAATLGVISLDVYDGNVLHNRISFENIYLDRESQIRMVISNSTEELGVTLLVTRNGYGVHSKSVASTGNSIVPTEIRLSNATQTTVEPLEWYAIQFSPTQALSAEQREIMIRQDSMFVQLDVSADSADFDNDGTIGGRDFLIWQRNFGMAQNAEHENGDANNDGRVDEFDLAIWRENYGTEQLSTFQSADFNQDAIVDSHDLTIWQNNYGNFGIQSEGDADKDGSIGGKDLLIWQRQCNVAQLEGLTADGVAEGKLLTPNADDFLATPAGIVSEDNETALNAIQLVNNHQIHFAAKSWVSAPTSPKQETKDEPLDEHQVRELVLIKKYFAVSDVMRSNEMADGLEFLSELSKEANTIRDWNLSADLAIENWQLL
jgi:hypothetical protein